MGSATARANTKSSRTRNATARAKTKSSAPGNAIAREKKKAMLPPLRGGVMKRIMARWKWILCRRFK